MIKTLFYCLSQLKLAIPLARVTDVFQSVSVMRITCFLYKFFGKQITNLPRYPIFITCFAVVAICCTFAILFVILNTVHFRNFRNVVFEDAQSQMWTVVGTSQKKFARITGISRTTIKSIHLCHQETDTIQNRPRIGKSMITTSRGMIKIIGERIWRDPKRLLKKLSEELNLKNTSVKNITKHCIRMCWIKLQKTRTLNEHMKTKMIGLLLHRLKRRIKSTVTFIALMIVILWWFGTEWSRRARHLWF